MCVILFKFLPPKISQLYSVEIRIIANKFNMQICKELVNLLHACPV